MVTLFQKLKFRVSRLLSRKRKEEAARIAASMLTKGQMGLELHYVDTPEAEIAQKLAEATSKIISSLAGTDEAIIRAGPVLVVKMTRNGVSQIASETVSPAIRKALDENPKMLRHPDLLFDFLQKHRDEQIQLANDDNQNV